MLIYAKDIINQSIIESLSLRKVGLVRDIIIDSEKGIVLGFLVVKSIFSGESDILSFIDARDFFANGVLINTSDNIVKVKEVVKIKNAISRKIHFLGSLVLTQNKTVIGYLEDFIFDGETGKVITLVVKRIFSAERRVIKYSRVLSILPRRVIIRDLTEKKRIKRFLIRSQSSSSLSKI